MVTDVNQTCGGHLVIYVNDELKIFFKLIYFLLKGKKELKEKKCPLVR